MQTWSMILRDLEQLVGLKLSSIRPGADLIITQVDRHKNRITIETKTGELKTRTLQELEEIHKALLRDGVVHVETVLGGSGSSRNQPETVLANLPYIEWLYIDNKKHIALQPSPSHPIGTLREMDPFAARSLLDRKRALTEKSPNFIVVAADIAIAVKAISDRGFYPTPLCEGAYTVSLSEQKIWLLQASMFQELGPGNYLVIPGLIEAATSTPLIELTGVSLAATPQHGILVAHIADTISHTY